MFEQVNPLTVMISDSKYKYLNKSYQYNIGQDAIPKYMFVNCISEHTSLATIVSKLEE